MEISERQGSRSFSLTVGGASLSIKSFCKEEGIDDGVVSLKADLNFLIFCQTTEGLTSGDIVEQKDFQLSNYFFLKNLRVSLIIDDKVSKFSFEEN